MPQPHDRRELFRRCPRHFAKTSLQGALAKPDTPGKFFDAHHALYFFDLRHGSGNESVWLGVAATCNQEVLHNLNATRVIRGLGKALMDSVQLGGIAKNIVHRHRVVEKFVRRMMQERCGPWCGECGQNHPAVPAMLIVSRAVRQTRLRCYRYLCLPVEDAVALETKTGQHACNGQE